MDDNAISVFQNGTTCTSLIHQLGRRTPRTTWELLNIASNHADGEEAVVATLKTPQGKGKQVADHGERSPSRFKKKKKSGKAMMRRQPHHSGQAQGDTTQEQPDQSWPSEGPFREALGCVVPSPRGSHQACAQGLPFDLELRQWYPQTEAGRSTKEDGAQPDNNDGAGAEYLGVDGAKPCSSSPQAYG
jgi:hypothetical protein